MTEDPTYQTQSLWSRAAALLATFVRRYLTAAQFAAMKQTPAILAADALTRVRRIEALARRVLFAQALGLHVTLKAIVRRARVSAPRKAITEAPLDGDPSTWRVRFSIPLPTIRSHQGACPPRDRPVRHLILPRPDRLERLRRAHRPYDPVYAARWRLRVKAREEAAYRAFWYAPWPPPKPTGPMYIELPLSNEPVDMASTLPIARRIEALNRVIADPAPYARRLAVRLARRPTRAPRVLAHWAARKYRALEGAETLRVAQANWRRRENDSS